MKLCLTFYFADYNTMGNPFDGGGDNYSDVEEYSATAYHLGSGAAFGDLTFRDTVAGLTCKGSYINDVMPNEVISGPYGGFEYAQFPTWRGNFIQVYSSGGEMQVISAWLDYTVRGHAYTLSFTFRLPESGDWTTTSCS